MRKWFKHLVVDQGEPIPSSRYATFRENAEAMRYDQQIGFSSQQDFIETYFLGQERYKTYDNIFRSVLRKEDKVLSIGSGRCANEVLLAKDGYDIICSDLEVLPNVKRLFPDLNFVSYDATKEVFPDIRFDCICVLGVLFLFDKLQLKQVLNNLGNSLKEKGLLIIDISGSEDNFPTFLIDNFITWYETYLKVFVLRCFTKNRKKVIRKHHGFRYTDNEFIDLVQEEGFKFISIDRSDYLTELERSYIVQRLGRKFKFLNNFFGMIGRMVPYVRVFIFEKFD